MYKFKFIGCVSSFGHIISNNYSAVTTAPSDKKAIQNIAFQYKKAHGMMPSAKIELCGKVVVIDG